MSTGDLPCDDPPSGGLPADVALLTSIFFKATGVLGQFTPVDATALPARCRALLAHDDHMTVTHEAFFGSLVDVHVLSEYRDDMVYARKSVLSRQSDGAVVQFGIMQIDLSQVDESARHEITEKQTPLGRILIRHNVLRHVELIALYEIQPGDELAGSLSVPAGSPVYGRTARIHVNGNPAVALLEIVRVPEEIR